MFCSIDKALKLKIQRNEKISQSKHQKHFLAYSKTYFKLMISSSGRQYVQLNCYFRLKRGKHYLSNNLIVLMLFVTTYSINLLNNNTRTTQMVYTKQRKISNFITVFTLVYSCNSLLFYCLKKMRMEIRNVSTRKKPDQRAEKKKTDGHQWVFFNNIFVPYFNFCLCKTLRVYPFYQMMHFIAIWCIFPLICFCFSYHVTRVRWIIIARN